MSAAYEVESRTWDGPNNDMTEVYTFSNGWGVEVVTDMSRGVVDSRSSARLIVIERGPVFTIGQPVSDPHIPMTPDPSAGVWFTASGFSPGAMTPDQLRVLCGLVAQLTPPVLDLGGCEWFARCDRDATHLEAHPAFPGGVPACDRCASIGK